MVEDGGCVDGGGNVTGEAAKSREGIGKDVPGAGSLVRTIGLEAYGEKLWRWLGCEINRHK